MYLTLTCLSLRSHPPHPLCQTMSANVRSSPSLSAHPSALAAADDMSESPCCRICHESQDDDPTRPLFHPCKCKGSLSFVHQDCLVTWLSLKPHTHAHSHGGASPTARCEVCNHPFTFDDEWEAEAPAAPSVTDLLADVWSSLYSLSQLLLAVASVRQAIVLTCLPLCPHLWQQLTTAVESLLFSSTAWDGLTNALSVAWVVTRTGVLLTVCSMVFSVLVITALHYCLLWWNHEVHLLLFRLKGQLERLRLRRRREEGVEAEDREAAGGGGGGEEGEDEWLMWWSAGIHALVEVQSVGELLEYAYCYHLLLSFVFLVLPYSVTVATLSSTSITLAALSSMPGLEFLSSLSQLSSYSLFSWLVSVHNGGLPLLLPGWMLSTAGFSYPATYFSSSFLFPSYLLHFTEQSLGYLHSVLHLSPLLHLLLFYALSSAVLLVMRPRHPIHVILLSILSATKVLTFVLVENFVFPAAMGVVVHLAFVPLLLERRAFESMASLRQAVVSVVVSHLVTALSSPLSALLSHWIYGLSYLITMTSTFNLLIKVTKRRVIALLLPSVRRRHDLFHEVISQRTTRLVRKVIRSFTLYASLCITLVGVTATAVRLVGRLPVVGWLVDAVLPLRVEVSHPLHFIFHCLLVALFFYFVWLGSTLTRRTRRKLNKRRMRRLVSALARLVHLHDYVLKGADELSRERAERLERRRAMRERRRREAEEDGVERAEAEEEVEVEVEGRVDSDDDTEDEIDRWMQETEMDHLIFEADLHQHHMQHAHGGGAAHDPQQPADNAVEDEDELPELLDEDELDAAAAAAADDNNDNDNDNINNNNNGDDTDNDDDVMQEVDPALLAHLDLQHMQPTIAATLARKQRDADEIVLERQERAAIPNFYPRLTTAIALLSTAFSLRTLWIGLSGVGVGRLVLSMVPLGFAHVNDVLAFMCGYTLLSYVSMPSSVGRLLAFPRLTVLKAGMLAVYFLVIFPLCLGLLTQLTLLLPFRLSLHQRPVFYLQQEWTVGAVLSLFLACSMYLHHGVTTHTHFDHQPPQPLPPPPPTPLTFFSPFATWYAHLVHLCSHTLSQCRLLSLLYDVLLPPSHFFVLHLALPYVVIKGLLPFRLLLPWPLRADELFLLRQLRSDEEGDAYTSRLLESLVERWAFLACVAVRLAVWMVGLATGWYGEYKAMAFERRWGTRRLRNVDDDEAKDEGKEREDDSDEEDVEEDDSDEEDEDSEEESDTDGDTDVALDGEDEKEERRDARKQRRETLSRRRQASAAPEERTAKAVSSAERMLYWTYSVGGVVDEPQKQNEEATDER